MGQKNREAGPESVVEIQMYVGLSSLFFVGLLMHTCECPSVYMFICMIPICDICMCG